LYYTGAYNAFMILNDKRMIQQALRTHTEEVEPLYWLLEDALHAGKTDKAKSLLEILLYTGKYKPPVVKDGLRPAHRDRLKQICYELLGNGAVREETAITMKPALASRKIPFKLESELQSYLVQNKDLIGRAVGEDVKIVGVEVKVDEDYRCDIVAESKERCYPIELKIAQGNHAVVSQCSKYCYYFYRKLRYGHFKLVQGVVIMNGADTWSINELRREGHWVYMIIPISDTAITLERIH